MCGIGRHKLLVHRTEPRKLVWHKSKEGDKAKHDPRACGSQEQDKRLSVIGTFHEIETFQYDVSNSFQAAEAAL